MRGGHIQMRIGDALRARREALGMSQVRLAKRLRMHRTYYSAIERGLKDFQIETLERICLKLGVHPWEILKDAEI